MFIFIFLCLCSILACSCLCYVYVVSMHVYDSWSSHWNNVRKSCVVNVWIIVLLCVKVATPGPLGELQSVLPSTPYTLGQENAESEATSRPYIFMCNQLFPFIPGNCCWVFLLEQSLPILTHVSKVLTCENNPAPSYFPAEVSPFSHRDDFEEEHVPQFVLTWGVFLGYCRKSLEIESIEPIELVGHRLEV